MDVADAFTCVDREAVLDALEKHCPDLFALVGSWISGSGCHVAHGGGDDASRLIDQHVGLDQGCPLSPALYAIVKRSILEMVELGLQGVDVGAKVLAYLDDTYLHCTALAGPVGIESLKDTSPPSV